MLKLGIIDSQDGFRALEPEWDALLSTSGDDNVFLTFGWIASWWGAFGEGRALHILTVRDDTGTLLAIAPLMRTRVSRSGIPVTAFSFIYNDNASHAGFIIKKGRARECLELVLSHFISMKDGWDILDLPAMCAGTDEYRALAATLEERRVRYSVKQGLLSPYIDLKPFKGGWNAYLGSRSRRFRKHVKQWTALDRGEGLRYDEITDTRAVPTAVTDLCEVSGKSWKARCGRHIGSSSANRRFYELLCDAASARQWLRLCILRVDGKPVATDLQLIYGSDVSGLRCDYDEEHKRLSPGCLLQLRIMRKNIEQGCAEYDFCGDNDGYKSSWVDQVRDHKNLTVYNATCAAAMVRLWDFGFVYRLKMFLKQSVLLRSLKRRITLGKP